VDPKTVRRYVAKRGAGEPVGAPVARPKLIDPFVGKIEELVETSEGAVRARLAEDATRLSDRPNPVSDEVWEEAAKHYT
jgi:hypothetical protein